LTSHARVLLCIARDPGVRLRDIAASVGITERSAHGIITDLTQAGYLTKQKDGRRNRYQIRAHLPLPEPASRQRTIGEVIDLLAADADAIPTTASGKPDRLRRWVSPSGHDKTRLDEIKRAAAADVAVIRENHGSVSPNATGLQNNDL
jgi:hypothetical protein